MKKEKKNAAGQAGPAGKAGGVLDFWAGLAGNLKLKPNKN